MSADLRDFSRLVRSEWVKLRSVRGWRIGLVAVVVTTVLLAWAGAAGSHSGYCAGSSPSTTRCYTGHPPVPTGPDGEAVADEFFFVHRSLPGNGTITAEITSLSGVTAVNGVVAASPGGSPPTRPLLAPWTKAGVILTAGTRPGAPYAAVTATGAHGVRWQYDYVHDQAGLPGSVSRRTPRWLRITRRGEVVTGYDSTDGVAWHVIGSTRLPGLTSRADVGLFATSPLSFVLRQSGTTTLATARFDHVATTGTVSGAWRSTAVGSNTFYPAYSSGRARQTAQSAEGASFTVSGSGDIGPDPGGGPLGGNSQQQQVIPLLVGVLVLIVLAAGFVTSEYRRGLIRTTLAASPRRGRVLAAKAVVIGLASFVVSLAAALIALPLANHVLTANGNYVMPIGTGTEARILLGTAGLVAVMAVGVVGLGTLFRRSAAAVSLGVVLLVLPTILGTVLQGAAGAWLFRLTPAAGFAVQQAIPAYAQVSYPYDALNGFYPLAPWAGFAVLCLWSALALGLGALALERRDG